MNKFDFWIELGYKLALFGILPIKLTENSKSGVIRLLGILLTIPWFILTIPIQLVLVMISLIIILIAIIYWN